MTFDQEPLYEEPCTMSVALDKYVNKRFLLLSPLLVMLFNARPCILECQSISAINLQAVQRSSTVAADHLSPLSDNYRAVQKRLAQGWNTWDVNSVETYVQLPSALAVHIGLKHNSTESGDAFLRNALIGRLDNSQHARSVAGAHQSEVEKIFPGPHSWDGSYTELKISWRGHSWTVQGAHEGSDLVVLVKPLPSSKGSQIPPTLVMWMNFLWNRPGSITTHGGYIEAQSSYGNVPLYCSCSAGGLATGAMGVPKLNIPVGGPYYAIDFVSPIALSTGRERSLKDVESIVARRLAEYRASASRIGDDQEIVDSIESTLGWDTIYDPGLDRVLSPVSRIWSTQWGGYVIFEWDNFFASTLSGIGDRDLAYANAIETLREETPEGFVPNYARAGGWKSSDRSEPPVGSMTVLRLYMRFHDRWFLKDTFPALLSWNRWWAAHRDYHGYLTWGSDGENEPQDLSDASRGTKQGAVLESGLDNSPMYDDATYDPQSHLLEFADVGLISLYIRDCDALAEIAHNIGDERARSELLDRAAHYRRALATLWNEQAGIFLNKNLHTGAWSMRLSPTNFYPLLAEAATKTQAERMINSHLLNRNEFWGEWVIPSIARNDPAFKDQNYWRGRIWGPMNYLVYLGLCDYQDGTVRRAFAEKSYALFLKEWKAEGHVHENYNAITGTGDDVPNSDRFYHWGALLGYIEYLEQTEHGAKPRSGLSGRCILGRQGLTAHASVPCIATGIR